MSNLYLVSTSYQLLGAAARALEESQLQKFKLYLVITKKQVFDLTKEIPMLYQIFDDITLVENFEPNTLFNKYFKLGINNFIFYQHGNIMLNYLAYQFKKTGASIYLGSDGAKPYATFKKSFEILSDIRNTILDRKLLFTRRLFLPLAFLSKYYRYASVPIIDFILLEYPSLFNNSYHQARAVVLQSPVIDNEFLSVLIKESSMEIPEIENAIIYFNQPFRNQETLRQEQTIVKQLKALYPNKPFLVKLHPSTIKESKDIWAKNTDVTILDFNYPAEFLLAKTSNCILITGWSTALMNKLGYNNEYFYTIKKYNNNKDPLLKQVNVLSFPHIKFL